MKSEKRNGQKGFTLLELMVVLIIIALTAATVIPRISAGWKRLEEREFLQQFIRALREGRLRAVDQGKVVIFRIQGDKRVYGFDPDPQTPIPENVAIYAERMDIDPATGDHLVLFYPDGSQSGAEIQIIFNETKTYRVSLHPLFGTLSWRRE